MSDETRHPSPRPVSARKLAANRANAKKSTGPRTPEGKARSSRNALTHGLTAQCPALPPEETAAFQAFYLALRADYRPRSAAEDDIFDEIVNVRWQQRRYRHVENSLITIEAANPDLLAQFAELHSHTTLTTFAVRELAEKSGVLHLLNRRIANLSRELTRLVDLYTRFHGPLNPSEAPAGPEADPADRPPLPFEQHVELVARKSPLTPPLPEVDPENAPVKIEPTAAPIHIPADREKWEHYCRMLVRSRPA